MVDRDPPQLGFGGPPLLTILLGPAEDETQNTMAMGLVFPKRAGRSRFSAGLNLHKALEENWCSSIAALEKRALETTGKVQRFSHTSCLGFISFYVNFHLSVSCRTAFAGMPRRWAPDSHGGRWLRCEMPSGSLAERVSDGRWSPPPCPRVVWRGLFPSPPQRWSQWILILARHASLEGRREAMLPGPC